MSHLKRIIMALLRGSIRLVRLAAFLILSPIELIIILGDSELGNNLVDLILGEDR